MPGVISRASCIPPVEFEQLYYERQAPQQSPTIAAGLN
jgi:hypothetical protein